jgi:peptidoglycan/xylan/chitin deacetylase (PgdA/CDA1 family)
MNRRQFINAIGTGAVSLGLASKSSSSSPSTSQVCLTMDDPNIQDTPRMSANEINRSILQALKTHSNLKAALFVCGRRVDSEAGKKLLGLWDAEGHMLANHSYSHHYYNSDRISFDTFSADILKGESLIKNYSRFTKLFRFPYLKEGNTAEKRDRARSFLKEQGYSNGYVTIDNSDWYIESRMKERLAANPKSDLSGYRQFYLDHLWDRATFYNDLALKAIGREIKHVLYIHHNLLSALFLDDLLSMFEKKGWKLTNAEKVYSDPFYSAAPKIVPAGESLVWALAKESGKFNSILRYPGEDGPYEKEKMDRLGL